MATTAIMAVFGAAAAPAPTGLSAPVRPGCMCRAGNGDAAQGQRDCGCCNFDLHLSNALLG